MLLRRLKRTVLIIVIMVLSFLCTVCAEENSNLIDNFSFQRKYTEEYFKDVKNSDWFYDSVCRAYELLLTEGNNGKFLPNDHLSVAESVTFASRIHSIYTNDGYSFEKTEPWYMTYIEYAIANGIIRDGEFFDYTKDASRAEFAGILERSLPKDVLPSMNEIAFSAIPDVDICDKYGEEIYHLYESGIVCGNDAIGTFKPNSSIARKEAIAIVVRMADKGQRVSKTLAEAPAVNEKLKYTTLDNIKSVYWLGTSFPVALGLPKLSDDEVAYLIEKHDYRYAAKAITTYADAANFLKQIGMDGEYGYESLYNNGKFFWPMSACQSMDLKSGGCAAMSEAVHYLLKEDFNQLLYCRISDEIGGHIMLIVKSNGKYYLTNPADLDIDGNWEDRWWEGHNRSGYVLVADNIKTIADSLVSEESGYYIVHTYESPGDVFIQSGSKTTPGVSIYPIGTEVTDWTGYGIEYMVFDCSPMPVPDWTTGEYYIEDAYIKEKEVREDSLAYIYYNGGCLESNSEFSVRNGEILRVNKKDPSGPTKIYTYTVSDPNVLECEKNKSGCLIFHVKKSGTVTLTLSKYGRDIVYTVNCTK